MKGRSRNEKTGIIITTIIVIIIKIFRNLLKQN